MNRSKVQIAVDLALHRYTNRILLFGIICCLFAYVYFANTAVRNVTLLEEVRGQVEILSASVSELESKNLTLTNKISMERAKSTGLLEANKPLFVVKASKNTLSLNLR